MKHRKPPCLFPHQGVNQKFKKVDIKTVTSSVVTGRYWSWKPVVDWGAEFAPNTWKTAQLQLGSECAAGASKMPKYPHHIQTLAFWWTTLQLLNQPTKVSRTLTFFFFPQQRKLMGSSAQISSGVCRCGSEEQVPEEGSNRFRRVPVCAGVGSGGNFRKAAEGPVFRKVQESSGVVCCLATLTGAAMLLFLNPFWWWHCPHGQNHCGTRMRPCSQTWYKATAVGDTTKAYLRSTNLKGQLQWKTQLSGGPGRCVVAWQLCLQPLAAPGQALWSGTGWDAWANLPTNRYQPKAAKSTVGCSIHFKDQPIEKN